MRVTSGLLLALAGHAACASQEGADVFLFNRNPPSTSRGPHVPKEIARHIFLQRTSTSKHGHVVHDIPETIDESTALSYVNAYGKSPAPLFEKASKGPSQLVVILQGVTEENSKPLRDAISKSYEHASFAISNPPSTAATSRLMDDFRLSGISNDAHCGFESAVNPFDKACWQGPSSVVLYDVGKSPAVLNTMIENMSRLSKFVSSGELEATLVLMPESSRSSALKTWHSTSARAPSDLRRRDFGEHPIAEDNSESAPFKPVSHAAVPAGMHALQTKAIPSCFTSESVCSNQTNNCSNHGECVNKYGNSTSSGKTPCFVCSCKSTRRKTNSTVLPEEIVEWGGAMCQKEDISAQFWLITGFSIVLVGAVTFAIGMLYSMGQEKLPGVIGAGVSRSK